MAKKKFTKEQERAYWQGKRDAYIAMSAACSTSLAGSGATPWRSTGTCSPKFLQERWAEGDSAASSTASPTPSP